MLRGVRPSLGSHAVAPNCANGGSHVSKPEVSHRPPATRAHVAHAPESQLPWVGWFNMGGVPMTLGLSLSAFTTLHVIISLIGIGSGLVVLCGMLASRPPGGWSALFLASTILTSVTGFMFPFNGLLPSHVVGAISLVLLAVALLALYVFRLAGSWRWIYVTTALAALYLNVFVGVVQAFQKLAIL